MLGQCACQQPRAQLLMPCRQLLPSHPSPITSSCGHCKHQPHQEGGRALSCALALAFLFSFALPKDSFTACVLQTSASSGSETGSSGSSYAPWALGLRFHLPEGSLRRPQAPVPVRLGVGPAPGSLRWAVRIYKVEIMRQMTAYETTSLPFHNLGNMGRK